MGKGIDLARADAPLHAAVLDDFKDQLIIVLIKRLEKLTGKPVSIPVLETDATGQDTLAFNLDGHRTRPDGSIDMSKAVFNFVLGKKS